MAYKHILLVDDEIETLRTLTFALNAKNYKVSTADNGKKALEMLINGKYGSAPYDMLITDIQMPGMRGDQLIDELHRNDIEIPVIAITGFGDKEIVVQLLRKGCHEYIDKPVNIEDLVNRIQILLDRKKIKNEQLKQMQKMAEVGTFAGEIAHDLNNILVAVIGYTDLAREKLESNNPACSDLDNVNSASFRAVALNNRLLFFTRKQTKDFFILNINDKVNDLLGIIKPVIGKKITIEVNLADNIRSIRAIEGDIDEIIMNLAVNARDAMFEEGKLIIKTENFTVGKRKSPDVKHREFVCLSVSDTGTGMSKETIGQIYKPFYTTKNKGKGTGLGLTTVYRIVKEHKGWIDVISKPDCGSTFNIYLPASTGESTDDIP